MSERIECANGRECVDVRFYGYETPAAVSGSTAEIAREHARWRGWAFAAAGEAVCDECAIFAREGLLLWPGATAAEERA